MSNQRKVQQGNILIVDDTPQNLRLLTQMLTKEGYQVRAALNGPRALAAVQATPPDLILLDIMMPEMDGYEVCNRLKADEHTRSIPVLFISALNETEDKVKGFAAGALDYIAKPFQLEEVLARVETHLKLSRLQRDIRVREEIYRELLNASPDAAYLVKTDGTILTWNQLGAKELSLPIDELSDKCIWDYLPPEVARERRARMELVVGSGQPDRSEGNWAGRYFDMVSYPLLDNQRKVDRIAIFVRDVTEHKRMEEELRRYSENLEMLIKESPAPIMLTDSHGRITLTNRSAENLMGYESGELLGRPLSKLLSEVMDFEVADKEDYPTNLVNKMGMEIPITLSTSVQLFKNRTSGVQEKGMIVTLKDLSEMQGLSIAPIMEIGLEATSRARRPKLEQGYIYLAEEEQPGESVAFFRDLVEHGSQGLCISRQRAEKFKSIHHLDKTPHIWLTRNKAQDENCIGPDELTKLRKTLENFIEKAEQGILLFDGLEYLIAQNGFDTVLKFTNSLNDAIMLHNSLAIWVLDSQALDTRELHILRKETRSLQTVLIEAGIRREEWLSIA
jgi:PAS domain S-box-containing protein